MIDVTSALMLRLVRGLFRSYKQLGSQPPAHETSSSYKLPATMPYTAVNAVSAADSCAPDKRKEWIIQIRQQSGSFISKAQLLGIFTDSWFQQYPSTLYGYIEAKGMWVKVQASSSITYFNKVQLGIPLLQKNNGHYTALSEEALQAHLTVITERTTGLQPGLDIVPQEPAARAAANGEKRSQLLTSGILPYTIVLHANTPFDNDRVYTTLSGRGIGNESGEITHYHSQGLPFTDFSIRYTLHVDTSDADTSDADAGTDNPTFSNIIFSMTILEQANPEQRWKMMVSTAKYCYLHLDGRLTDGAGNDFNEEKMQTDIMQAITQLKAKGLEPGIHTNN